MQSTPDDTRTFEEVGQNEAFTVTGNKTIQARSNSHSMALQTKQRIKEYLQQRQALTNA